MFVSVNGAARVDRAEEYSRKRCNRSPSVLSPKYNSFAGSFVSQKTLEGHPFGGVVTWRGADRKSPHVKPPRTLICASYLLLPMRRVVTHNIVHVLN